MQEGDKAEHEPHAAPFIAREAFTQGNAGALAHYLVQS